jgi:hypothetical protein
MYTGSDEGRQMPFVLRARLANPINMICLLLLFLNIGVLVGDLMAERMPRWEGIFVCFVVLIASVSFFSSMSIRIDKDFLIIKRLFIFRELLCWQDVLGWRRSASHSGGAIRIPRIEIALKKGGRVFIPVQPFKSSDLKTFISLLESRVGVSVK